MIDAWPLARGTVILIYRCPCAGDPSHIPSRSIRACTSVLMEGEGTVVEIKGYRPERERVS